MASLDFDEGLPRPGGKDCIIVVVDKFSKYSHFVPLSHPYTAFSVAKLYVQHIYIVHSMPHSIVSYHDIELLAVSCGQVLYQFFWCTVPCWYVFSLAPPNRLVNRIGYQMHGNILAVFIFFVSACPFN
jgi:hypothetical protein